MTGARRGTTQRARASSAREESETVTITLSNDLPEMRLAFDRYFTRALASHNGGPPRLDAAIRYSALSPGKRLRPLLTLTACQASGGSWRRALPAAAAVECVHAFSLVHDDLPCMDDDDYRRGRLTTHKKFGQALGVLAGDALLARAFEEMSRLSSLRVPAPQVVEATRVLARAAGGSELIAGQALDLAAEGKKVGAKEVRAIHDKKTGALFSAALEIGGRVAGAGPSRLRILRLLGRELGLAFQIHDDLLDRSSSLKRLGKRSKKDAKKGKATYPGAVGDQGSRLEAGRLYLKCLRSVERMGIEAWNLGHLILGVAERDG